MSARMLCLTVLLLSTTPAWPAETAKAVVPAPSKGILTPEQRQSLTPVWVAFGRLKAATEVGTTPSGYGERLIDLKAALDPPLAKLPAGPVKRHLCRAILAYLDALTVWNDAGSGYYKSVFKETNGYRRVREYRLPWHEGGQFDKVTEDEYSPWLRTLWTKAAAYARNAQGLASRS
jgi:hypothetical protein